MGLKSLLSNLHDGKPFGATFPQTNTPVSIAGGFNYGESISIFDSNLTNQEKNSYFPFKQRSMGYAPQGIKDNTGMFGRLHGPAPYRKQQKLKLKIFGPNDYGPDIGFMGGLDSVTDVGIRGGLATVLKRSVIDAARIGEFMLSAKGLGFIAKNVGLQMTNPKLQEGAGSKFLGMNLGTNNRIYNLGINTLAQTLTAATGLHVNRAGLLPIGAKNYNVEQGYRVDTNNKNKYEWNVRGSNPEEEGGTGNITDGFDVYKSNRLTALYNKLLGPDGNDILFPEVAGELYDFRGGPHSVYGIGKTRLKRYVFSNRDADKANAESIEQLEGYTYSRHLGDKNGPDGRGKLIDVVDFRKFRGIPYTDYNQKIGDGGQSLSARFGYARGVQRFGTPANKDGTVNVRASHPLADKINSTDIWRHEGPWDNTDLGSKVRDYIKFRIEAVNTDKPTESNTMVFRAFLDSMDDSYSSKWNEYNYNGRAEPLYTFGSFNRAVGFSFKVAAFSRDDMRPMYRKLNYLVSQTAGEYNQTRLRGNFCRLTIGDYHSRLPGFFTNIKINWSKEYPWEIAMYQKGVGTKAQTNSKSHTSDPESQLVGGNEQMLNNMATERTNRAARANNGTVTPIKEDVFDGPIVDMDSDMLELPQILDVSCQFQPVHDFIPTKGIDSPFILPNKFNKSDLTKEQNWLDIDPISQDDRKASLDRAAAEEAKIDEDYELMLEKEEEEAIEAEKKRKAELEAEWEAQVKADEEWMEANPIEEEDDPEPWDQPDTGTVNPDPNTQVFVPGAGGGYDGGFGGGGGPPPPG